MDKKPNYKQSGIVFLMIGIVFFIDAEEVLLKTGWMFYLAIVVIILTIIYAIMSSAIIEKREK